jgi:hypothetical protein
LSAVLHANCAEDKVKLSMCLINWVQYHEDLWGSGDIDKLSWPWH